MDVPAIQNGFKYRLNGHRKEFRTEAVNIRMALEKISFRTDDASRSNDTGQISNG